MDKKNKKRSFLFTYETERGTGDAAIELEGSLSGSALEKIRSNIKETEYFKHVVFINIIPLEA